MGAEILKPLYFIRKSGRITGPFSQSRLQSMFKNDALPADTVVSADKQHWRSIADFLAKPSSPPRQKVVLRPEKEAPQLPEQENLLPQEPFPGADGIGTTTEEIPVSFISDIARTIALLWDHEMIYPECCSRSGRIFAIAAGLVFTIFTVMAVVFAGGSRISSVAMAWALLAALSCLVFAAAKTAESVIRTGGYQILAGAFLMDYGMIAGCTLAWKPILFAGNTGVDLLWIFLAGFSICCATMHLYAFTGKFSRLTLCMIPVMNSVAGAAIYFLIM